MIEALQKNVTAALGIVTEMSSFIDQAPPDDPTQQRMMYDIVRSLRKKLFVLNQSIPPLVKELSLNKTLSAHGKRPEPKIKVTTTQVNPESLEVDKEQTITLPSSMRSSFIKELEISEALIKRLKKKKSLRSKKEPTFKKANMYARLSNKYFLKTAQLMVAKGYFKSLGLDIRRSNMNILTVTYLSMMFFSMTLGLIAGVGLMVVLLFLTVTASPPFITLYDGSYLLRFIQVVWAIFAVPLVVGVLFYLYPGAEQKSTAKRIEGELPFVVVHMGSIAGSGIEPIEIFKIIAMSKDYKYAGKEVKKILNQTNVYGYDLTTALRNVARSTPSPRLSELLNGMSITINSGGDMKTFFEKRAESLLLEYRIEREKFTKNAETVMDIYISVVISTPMILLLLLIMISVSGISVGGLSVEAMSFGVIAIVAVINIIFLAFLQMRQPSY